MKKHNFITYFILSAGILFSGTSQAFVIMDALTKAADIVEEGLEVAKTVHEKVMSIEATQRDTKIGSFGEAALGPYNKIKDVLKQKRKLSPLDIPEYFEGAENDVSKADAVMKVEYTTSYGSGGDMTKAKDLQRSRLEIQHNHIASVYAKAYTIRFYLKEARKKGDPQFDLKDSREILQAGRVYAEQTTRRLMDVLTLETALLEFENTQFLVESDTLRKDIAEVTEEYND